MTNLTRIINKMKIFHAGTPPLIWGGGDIMTGVPDEFYNTARPEMKDPAAGRLQLLARPTD
ncbi:hypothetical protein SMY00_001727 [Cronobacter sakazakii]|uniref:hypothetical protein n=1 Tax=Cronobacter sakazakii TaxID=28141 RepID=UPI0013FDB82E|nr:hypothetical protein [Cronobacter sakazakii]EIV2968215.1 hypothetical protein [Cronobacter sakazakii]ELY3811799.1 hypothetical protein [Cronobacter sakazakii]